MNVHKCMCVCLRAFARACARISCMYLRSLGLTFGLSRQRWRLWFARLFSRAFFHTRHVMGDLSLFARLLGRLSDSNTLLSSGLKCALIKPVISCHSSWQCTTREKIVQSLDPAIGSSESSSSILIYKSTGERFFSTNLISGFLCFHKVIIQVVQWVGIVPESGEVLTHHHHLCKKTALKYSPQDQDYVIQTLRSRIRGLQT